MWGWEPRGLEMMVLEIMTMMGSMKTVELMSVVGKMKAVRTVSVAGDR